MQQVPEQTASPAAVPLQCLQDAAVPRVLRGLIDEWPAVIAARESAQSAAGYLRRFDARKALTVYAGSKAINGRFFYNEDCTGFNFVSGRATLEQVLERLVGPPVADDIETVYVGSTPVDGWLPGFRAENDLAVELPDAMVSFWLGNRTTVSAHFDFPDNLACVVAGRRRFTLFPPDQLENLYIGPIDRTPSGQAISLVDFDAPDFERFPRFAEALEHALIVDLEPGDVLFVPSMWWHHVRAQEDFNLLINYWWCSSPAAMGAPSAALQHALLALRDLPPTQRSAWKRLFDYYVFDVPDGAFDHIPEPGRGLLGTLDETRVRQARAELLNRLNQ